MLSLQEISDRMEIQDLITRYVQAIDHKDWDMMDEVFTPEAIIDYTEVGGERGTRDDIKHYLMTAMARFPVTHHITTNSQIQVDGDKATAVSILFNPMLYKEEDAERMVFIGLWYHDDLVRTPEGWRIVNRKEKKGWHFNTPEGMMPKED